MDRSGLSAIKRLVIKVGTSTLIKNDQLDYDYLSELVGQIAELRKQCPSIVLVTSGAIGLGKQELGMHGPVRDIRMRQACASVGMPLLMQAYRSTFLEHGITVSQVLLTRDVFNDRQSYLNLRNSVETLCSLSVIPIMNENDSVSTFEIDTSFGDNDTLSALVASKLDAELLCILSDVDSFYTKDPNRYKNAKRLSYVESVSPDMWQGAGDAGRQGRGGMKSKLDAAEIAASSGCGTVLAHAKEERVLVRILAGEEIGTFFAPRKKLRNRSRWILYSTPAGSITVDEGALQALSEHKNLLVSGVVAVSGNFHAGTVVTLNNCGRMICQFGSKELSEFIGMHSTDVERIAGKGRRVLARADDIVFIDEKDVQ